MKRDTRLIHGVRHDDAAPLAVTVGPPIQRGSTVLLKDSAALKDYGLAIRWPECQQFDTNITGTYQWCPLARLS